MIHYTLLPEKEIKSLKREYKVRIFVTLAFFLSCGVIIGIVSLFPALIFSYSQGKGFVDKIQTIQKDREASGIDTISNNLSESYQMVVRLKIDEDSTKFSEMISKISKLRANQITLTSFQMAKIQDTATSSISITIQGKASTRESLIEFKKNLESDKKITKIELPISDLTKSKNILFSVRLILDQ